MRILAAILFCSLTATSAVAQDVDTGDSLPGAVDGSPVITAFTPRSVPKRAPSSDYTYTYKGVKYTYITENNYTRYFNTGVHKPSDYGWYTDADGWYVNAEKAYITAASIGTRDICTPVVAASLYENIPQSQWHLFRHSRHTCFIDAHEEYCQVLTRWLQEHD